MVSINKESLVVSKVFSLDSRIESDSIFIKDLELCQLRLQNDSRYPWLVLVPRVTDVTEVHQLSESQQQQLIRESSLVAQAIKSMTQCDKVNVANLGNVVAQLHWHVVARFESDDTWPAPIWGVGSAVVYENKKRAEFIDSFVIQLNQLLV